ncbi:MAG: TolC family protein [Bacteroidia bacterium]
MHKAYFTLILFTATSLSAQTTEKWNLQKCVDYALEHNTSIQQNELQGDILANNLNQAKLSRIPTLNGSGNHNYNIGRTIDPFTNTFNNTTIQSNSFSLNSGVLLYGGSQINNRIKQSEVASDANAKSTDVIRNQIALSVATTYLQIIQAEENLKVADAQQLLTKSQLERARLLEKSGATNQSNMLMLEAQAASDQVAKVNAQNAIQIAYNTLINLMQLPLDQAMEIEQMDITSLPEYPSESVAQIYEMAIDNLPEIQQAELQIRQSELGEKIAGASLQPSVSAYGNINTVYSQSGKEVTQTEAIETFPIGFTQNGQEPVLSARPVTVIDDKAFTNQLSDNLGQQVGVSLSVPIFNGYRNKTALENARLNTQISELGLENTKNQLRNDVTTAATNLKAAKSRYDAALANERAQQLSYEFSQKRFGAGVMNSVDLLTSKNLWNQAQVQAINAKYEYVFRALIIDFYKGNQLKL